MNITKVTDLPYKPENHKPGYPKLRDPESVDTVVIHHSATRRNTPDSMRTIRAFARYHTGTMGWHVIAYTYIIDQHGVIYQVNDPSTVSYHAGNRDMNIRSYGICLIGNNMKDPPTAEQLDATIALVKALGRPIIAHREVKGTSTSCPGNLTDSWWVELEEEAPDVYIPNLHPLVPVIARLEVVARELNGIIGALQDICDTGDGSG